MKNGISVREKSTKRLVKFIECDGRRALRILGGIRINMSPKYVATEEGVEEEEIKKMKGDE